MDYLLEQVNGMSLRELVEAHCSHIERGHIDHDNCLSNSLWIHSLTLPDLPLERCMAAAIKASGGCSAPGRSAAEELYCVYSSVPDTVFRDAGLYPNRYADCLPLARDTLADYGLEYYHCCGGLEGEAYDPDRDTTFHSGRTLWIRLRE